MNDEKVEVNKSNSKFISRGISIGIKLHNGKKIEGVGGIQKVIHGLQVGDRLTENGTILIKKDTWLRIQLLITCI